MATASFVTLGGSNVSDQIVTFSNGGSTITDTSSGQMQFLANNAAANTTTYVLDTLTTVSNLHTSWRTNTSDLAHLDFTGGLNLNGALTCNGSVNAGPSSTSLTLGGNSAATGTGCIVNNQVTLTGAGKIISFQNNSSEKAYFDGSGSAFANALSVITKGVTSGSPGNATANTGAGKCAIAASASSVVITNNLVAATSMVFAVINQASADSTLTQIVRVVPAAGSFTIYGNAAATAAVTVNWFVVI